MSDATGHIWKVTVDKNLKIIKDHGCKLCGKTAAQSAREDNMHCRAADAIRKTT